MLSHKMLYRPQTRVLSTPKAVKVTLIPKDHAEITLLTEIVNARDWKIRVRQLGKASYFPFVFRNDAPSIEHFQPSTQRVRGDLQGLKRPRRKVVHSLSHSAKAKNEWKYTSTTLHAYLAWKGTLIFLFTGIVISL
jgi:hypothetical protein